MPAAAPGCNFLSGELKPQAQDLHQEWNKQRKAIINKYREQDEKQLESRDKKQTVIQGHEELSAEYPR